MSYIILSILCVNGVYFLQKVIGTSVKQAVFMPLYTVPERCGLFPTLIIISKMSLGDVLLFTLSK